MATVKKIRVFGRAAGDMLFLLLTCSRTGGVSLVGIVPQPDKKNKSVAPNPRAWVSIPQAPPCILPASTNPSRFCLSLWRCLLYPPPFRLKSCFRWGQIWKTAP